MKREKIKIPKDCCIGCGKRKHPDKSTRPSKDTLCTCGRTGHLAHLCLRNGKPRKPKELKGTIEIEDQSGNAESSNLLSEACFRLQNNAIGVEGGATQLHVKGQGDKEVGEMNMFEKSTLNSVWYDDKNAQWKTEISDEEANGLKALEYLKKVDGKEVCVVESDVYLDEGFYDPDSPLPCSHRGEQRKIYITGRSSML